MTTEHATQTPLFEIDQPEIFGDFFLTRDVEIISYLRALEKQHAIVTIYLGDGQNFFLSTLLKIDDSKKSFFLDLANSAEMRRLTENSPQLTLTATLEKVKIQIRINTHKTGIHEGSPALEIPIPNRMLRLQRREYFRLETSLANPLQCKITRPREEGKGVQVLNLKLLDISGGGLSLMASQEQAEQYAIGSILAEGRLEIPGENFIPVNLCVKKITAQQDGNGQPCFSIGCEFMNLPGTRLAQIQRYITRVERERKTREA